MNQKFENQAVVLANGSFPQAPMPLKLLSSAPYLVACDGATNQLVLQGITPNLIIGDGDSISIENRKRYQDIFLQIADQETNDLTKAINYLESIGKTKIAVLGATGGRDDHALGNISLLIEYLQRGIEVRMYTDHGIFIPLNGNQLLKSHNGQQVSIFNFGATNFESIGLKYPIYDFNNWWQGTLNEALCDEFSILATGNYIVYLAYPELKEI